jgi:pyridoxamine 5'-phosphate oxidase-like protein
VARWSEIEQEAPELAATARQLLDAGAHKTLATLRRDGSPRISGTEIEIRDGDLWFGGMWQSVKALDLLRDPRFALHGPSVSPPGWRGDAKLAGRAEEVTDPAVMARMTGGAPPGPSHLFRADVTELSVVRLAESGDSLVVESWHAGRGTSRVERR